MSGDSQNPLDSVPDVAAKGARNPPSFVPAMESGRRGRDNVSCREYYCYKFQIRPGTRSILLHSSCLFQQYAVDMYVKLETSRLDYFRLNQSTIRAELYSGIVDSISVGEVGESETEEINESALEKVNESDPKGNKGKGLA